MVKLRDGNSFMETTEKTEQREFWLRGPIPGLAPLLQPIGHALLQAREEVTMLMDGFPPELSWSRPAGVASPGFHLQHLAGVLDRLFTYARGEALSGRQLEYLAGEGRPGFQGIPELVGVFRRQVDRALEQLAVTPESSLSEPRGVGRAQIPSTVGGLLFHAAEHIQRHTGQLIVTVKVLLDQYSGNPCDKSGV
jgi:hypothetical protein